MVSPISKNGAWMVLQPLALAAIAALAPKAQAQSVPAPAASASAPAGASAPTSAGTAPGRAVALETVVVTANRRSELVKDVAGSVGVLGGAQMERLHVTSIQDVAGLVSGLQVAGDNPGMKRQTIRGITTGTLQTGASVASYLDEAPISFSSGVVAGVNLSPDVDPLDLARIEVLKGPQGSLYGASALGGLIKYVTVTPNLKELEGRAEVGYSVVDGGGGGFSARGSINVPVSRDVLAVRLTAYSRKDPGHVDDALRHREDVNSFRNEGARVTAYLKPSARWDAKLMLDTQTIKTPDGATPRFDASTLEPVDGGHTSSNVFAQPLKNTYDRAALTVNVDLGFANLLSVTSLLRQKSELTADASRYLSYLDFVTAGAYAAAGLPVTPLGVTGALSFNRLKMDKKVQEFRLTSPSGQRLEWLAGVFFQKETGDALVNYDAFTGTNLGTPAVPGYVHGLVTEELRESAIYANTTYHFTDRVDVQLGLRHTRLTQDYDSTVQNYNYLVGAPVALPSASARTSERQTTWMLSPRWKLGDDDMVYLRAASGYRPGGPNTPPLAGEQKPPFHSDSIVNYELGYKGQFPAAKLELTAALFRIDWKDIQVTAVDPTYAFSYYTNGGKAHTQGLELEAGWRPWAGLRLGANLTAMQARLDQDVPEIGGQRGDAIPYTPKFSAGLTADYSWAIGPGQASVGATWVHTGKRGIAFSHQSATPLAPGVVTPTLPAYDLVDFRASYAWDQLTLSLFVKNAFNKRGLLSYSGGSSAITDLVTGVTSPANVAVTTPRTIGISLRADF
ncbi:TonB-dependent receptor [Mitsuaria sp. GD03876]|uniref:TonB-dependent receptor n=1 Tax=Mitsuaria sp. GD03876 TaxID=2975399 RepID=UPI00244B3C9E|nr:TonB-dependent receptor [Mitsuaria sp. GD03876]MDH0866507.1 TonB-dependent receptor [Mitsuaria sp. GD03876]